MSQNISILNKSCCFELSIDLKILKKILSSTKILFLKILITKNIKNSYEHKTFEWYCI